ncbi:Multidrug resistance efflux pump EmrA (EmrA) (PDB:4TKO) [Commensalibacter communis]|uniref:Membrane fusion protein (MFP) family protein n=1 Tax=Commensalibacter communis TaxID=2972786 RepID=A0A9W4TSM1_9PROT|nr:HlyD family type I secretion periplasmic adaptor subunit [Commensalibacter communis]CAI3949674.1 Multidrug resistance efflux pump EmrA (EmrA) (PDB:4TKO) [Commensalibacter communis]CAI3950217.1 Multidrug resistance efflux pump EmrA (EmrA) (PDB:4TKO) [Commensalibacter communis]CAI3951823.1 Multidrug resistance efflux pump EmrA (EmrA) (PDB:4TKO) [Commensalibacter communis]CAI3951845.1 Multidrug resistance efflux pump EmrA (EmrA) (PDB:4TKO) [Commensalibacter communis]CAI3952807.1 Multidrug resi
MMVDDNKHDQLPKGVQPDGKNNIENGLTQSDENQTLPKKNTQASDIDNGQDDDNHVPDGYYLPEADSDDSFQADMPIALLEFHSPTSAVINMPPTASAQYITWLMGGLATFSFIGMCFFPLDKVVSAEGRLISTETPLLVQPLEQSIIKSIDVKEGDFVTKGQVIAHLDPTLSDADIDNLKVQVGADKAEYDRLRAEADGKTYTVDPSDSYSVEQGNLFLKRKLEYDAKVAGFDQKIAEQQAQLKNSIASIAVLRGRVKVASDVHQMRTKLQQEEVGSKLSTLGSQDTLMDVENRLITAQQTANATAKRIESLQSERTAYIENWKGTVYKELNAAIKLYARDEGDYKKARLRKNKVMLKAEQDSIVLSITKGSVGSVLNAGVPFITLIPVGTGLEVEAAVSGDEIGYLKLGDKANIKFNTFPYTQYGGAEAILTNISADVFQPGDMTQETNRLGNAPLTFRDKPFFRARLKIEKYTLHNVPNFFHPTPGLTVSADIHVGKRTVAQYLLNGIVPQLTNGMRDPQ